MIRTVLTNDQYTSIHGLCRWYDRYQHQFIEIAGVVGTGIWEVIQEFIELSPLDPREVMYLSYDQKQVLELAFQGYHCYYLNSIIYNYQKFTDINSLPVVSGKPGGIQSTWKKILRNGVDKRYKLIVIFDSTLLSLKTINDIGSLGLPVILVRDPLLLPTPDSYTFTRDPNVTLREVNPEIGSIPIVYFAHRIIHGNRLEYGSYDNVNIVPRKQMNLYNLRSADMNVTLGNELRHEINATYRSRILNRSGTVNVPGERIIVTNTMYREKLRNPDNKKVRVYLAQGLVGTIAQINKHSPVTRYVKCDIQPDGYTDNFTGIMLDRYSLNGPLGNSTQERPDDVLEAEYAYALSAPLARYSHWDKVTVTLECNRDDDPELYTRLAYTAITRAKKSLTVFT